MCHVDLFHVLYLNVRCCCLRSVEVLEEAETPGQQGGLLSVTHRDGTVEGISPHSKVPFMFSSGKPVQHFKYKLVLRV